MREFVMTLLTAAAAAACLWVYMALLVAITA
jgi:hypothetical protein